MKALLQRVSEARVLVDDQVVGEIAQGLLVLLCAERGDTEAAGQKLLDKLLKLRIFYDDSGKMNRSVQDGQGGLLLVSQFTLAADTQSGTRPSFSAARQRGHGCAFCSGPGRSRHRPGSPRGCRHRGGGRGEPAGVARAGGVAKAELAHVHRRPAEAAP